MASFSLEWDGLFIPDEQVLPKEISEDPFDVLDKPEKSGKSVLLDPKYSDISDNNDLEIPCSQKRLPSR